MKTFTFCSFKGGTSKTSTALHLGACLAKSHNKRVLLVDFDAQANLTIGLGFNPDKEISVADVINFKFEPHQIIQKTNIENLHLMPSNAYLDGIEKSNSLAGDPYAHERLRRCLQTLSSGYDYCFIDTPPSLGWLTQSAYFASQYSLVCAIPEAFSVLALRRLKDFQETINRYHIVDVFGVVLTFWDERGATNQTFLDKINETYPNLIFDSKVRRDISVSRAVLEGKTIFEFAKDSRASEDYKALTKEFLNKG